MAKTKTKAKTKAKPRIMFVGRLEIEGDPQIKEVKLAGPLATGARFAALLEKAEIRPHLYVVHKAADKLVTVLAYADTAKLRGTIGASLRIPQQGVWLWSPGEGKAFVLASSKWVSYDQIVERLKGRAPEAGKGTDKTL